jgi:hypothetical protein
MRVTWDTAARDSARTLVNLDSGAASLATRAGERSGEFREDACGGHARLSG